MAPFSLSTRPRRSLPDGYQFGDARPDPWTAMLIPELTETHESWNVIEGAPYASDAERHPVIEGFIAQRDLGDETTQ